MALVRLPMLVLSAKAYRGYIGSVLLHPTSRDIRACAQEQTIRTVFFFGRMKEECTWLVRSINL